MRGHAFGIDIRPCATKYILKPPADKVDISTLVMSPILLHYLALRAWIGGVLLTLRLGGCT